MRIGCVKFANARPLDYGFRKGISPPDSASLPAPIEIVQDTPARLVEMLRAGKLDTALISSIECFRNRDTLSWNENVGVCASDHVRSILYIRRREDTSPPLRLYMDSGSRSSAALLQVFLKQEGLDPEIVTLEPGSIPDSINRGEGGLLIGDSALRFAHSTRSAHYDLYDLAHMWRDAEALPFVFALWAYPRQKPLPDDWFEHSLQAGEKAMDEISKEFEIPRIREYLTETLHYRLGPDEHRALERFKELTSRFGLLS